VLKVPYIVIYHLEAFQLSGYIEIIQDLQHNRFTGCSMYTDTDGIYEYTFYLFLLPKTRGAFCDMNLKTP